MDPLVDSALSHWAPRFEVNGVSAADLGRITARIRGWSDWCRAWSEIAAEHEELGRSALDGLRWRSAGEHLARAAVHYHFGKFVLVDDVEQARAAHERAVACLTAALPHLDPPGRRMEIPFDGALLVGILRLPVGGGPHPVVLLLAGLDSTKEELGATEQTFLARGLATFTLDGPGQGESEADLGIRGDWAPVAEAVWDLLAGQAELDPDRVAVWGVSLGGYYSARVAAALGDRIRCAVSLSGPFDWGDCWSTLPELTRRAFEVRSRATDADDAQRRAGTLSLRNHAGDIVAPMLVVCGREDRLVPWAEGERLAGGVGGPAELLVIEHGNHGCANAAPWHRPYTADWVAARLGTWTA